MRIEATGSTQPPIVFNTTGRKGMLNQLLYESPWYTHIFEVSGLMEDDAITPIVAVTKQIRITFSSDGSLDALQTVMEAIASGRDRHRAIVTARIGLDEVPDAFRALERPNDHVKILVCRVSRRRRRRTGSRGRSRPRIAIPLNTP